MTERHPSRELLARFLRGELGPPLSKSLVRHLIAGCARCVEEARRLWGTVGSRSGAAGPGGAEALHPWCYGEAFRRVLERGAGREAAVAREIAAAPRLAEELLRHPPERRLTLIVNSRRFRTVALCERLLGTAAALWPDDPAAAEEVAQTALAVAERLGDGTGGAALAASLQGRAWAYLGNARRLRGALAAAAEAFERAQPLLDAGSGDPLERAEVAALRAALAAAQGRPALAAAFYDRACHVYRALGEKHLLGRTLLVKCGAAPALHPMARLALLREGLALLDERLEPRLAAESYQQLVAGLVEVELPGEALLYLQKAQALFRNLEDEVALLRLRRLEGRIAAALGRPVEAERLLLEAWMGLVAARLGRDAAGVTLDLARLYARERWTGASRRLARQLTPLFRAHDLDRRAIPGLLVLQRLLETETANPEFLAELERYLSRSWLRRAS